MVLPPDPLKIKPLPREQRIASELDPLLPIEALESDLDPERLFPLLRLALWTGYLLGRRDTKADLERRLGR